MIDLLSGGVMRGLVGAASSAKALDTTMSVYNQSQNKGDETGKERALEYASDQLSGAMDSAAEAKQALADNARSAREQGKADLAEQLEKIRTEAKEKQAEAETGDEGKVKEKPEPVDKVELSPGAAGFAMGSDPAEIQKRVAIIDPAPKPSASFMLSI